MMYLASTPLLYDIMFALLCFLSIEFEIPLLIRFARVLLGVESAVMLLQLLQLPTSPPVGCLVIFRLFHLFCVLRYMSYIFLKMC